LLNTATTTTTSKIRKVLTNTLLPDPFDEATRHQVFIGGKTNAKKTAFLQQTPEICVPNNTLV
jgi:hypothetical protein